MVEFCFHRTPEIPESSHIELGLYTSIPTMDSVPWVQDIKNLTMGLNACPCWVLRPWDALLPLVVDIPSKSNVLRTTSEISCVSFINSLAPDEFKQHEWYCPKASSKRLEQLELAMLASIANTNDQSIAMWPFVWMNISRGIQIWHQKIRKFYLIHSAPAMCQTDADLPVSKSNCVLSFCNSPCKLLKCQNMASVFTGFIWYNRVTTCFLHIVCTCFNIICLFTYFPSNIPS